MCKGLTLTRSAKQTKNTLLFTFQDSAGEIIQIKQTVVKGGSQVRLHIEAPPHVAIMREELVAC